MIRTSKYLLVFIQNLHMHPAEKILLVQPLTFGGITPASSARGRGRVRASSHTLSNRLDSQCESVIVRVVRQRLTDPEGQWKVLLQVDSFT